MANPLGMPRRREAPVPRRPCATDTPMMAAGQEHLSSTVLAGRSALQCSSKDQQII